MDPLLSSALIGAGASVAGGLSSVFGQKSANSRNIALMREQMRWQERMMHYQNEYNTPALQMQRFKNAGLNPNLIYGQLSPQNSAGVQGVSQPHMENEMSAMPEMAGQISNNMQNVANIQAQRELLKSQARLNNANALDKENELPHNVQKREYEKQSWKKTLDQMDATLRETNAKIQNIFANTGLTNASTIKTQEEAKSLLQQRMFNRQYLPMQLSMMQKELNMKDYEFEIFVKRGQLLSLQIVGQNTQNQILQKECNAFGERLFWEIQGYKDKHDIDFQTWSNLLLQGIGQDANNQNLLFENFLNNRKMESLTENRKWWLFRTLDNLTTFAGMQIQNLGGGLKLFGGKK